MSEPKAPVLTVIIVNLNGARFLPRCLESLRKQSLRDFRVLLADNGSIDESVWLTRRDYPEVDILEYRENLGYARANNKAATLAQAKYLLFLNNDTHLDQNALAALVTFAEDNPSTPILAPQLRTYDGLSLLHVGLGVDVLGYPCHGKVFYAEGSSLFIRRDVFCELGGFDPSYFMFFEEADLCWRAWLRGYRVGTVPQAIVYHKAGGTAGTPFVIGKHYSTSTTRRRLGHRNQLANLLKNYSMYTLLVAIPLFATLTVAEVALLVVTGQGSAVRAAYIPAWRDLVRGRSHLWMMRRKVQSSRTVSDWAILRRMEWKLASVNQFFRSGVPRVN